MTARQLLAREVKNTIQALRRVERASLAGDGRDEAAQLEAHSEQLAMLDREVTSRLEQGTQPFERHRAASEQIEELRKAVAHVLEETSPEERARAARRLLRALHTPKPGLRSPVKPPGRLEAQRGKVLRVVDIDQILGSED